MANRAISLVRRIRAVVGKNIGTFAKVLAVSVPSRLDLKYIGTRGSPH